MCACGPMVETNLIISRSRHHMQTHSSEREFPYISQRPFKTFVG